MTSPTTARILAGMLAGRGVRHAFGMPGGVTLPLLEAFGKEGIDFVLVRDEASAGFMADATWQLTGAPGVCVATLGPGATNLVSGVAGCLMDRANVVAITGQIDVGRAGIYTHQTLDQMRLFEPVTKHAVTLTREAAGREIALALRHLDEGRPGPILLNIPGDVAQARQDIVLPDRFQPSLSFPGDLDIEQACTQLSEAFRPVIVAGLSDLGEDTAKALNELATALRAPVMTTYKAKGLVDERGPWSAGAMGLSPRVDEVQQQLIAGSDVLLAVGLDPVELRPNWLPGWPAELPVITVDPVPPVDLVHPVEAMLTGDVPGILHALAAGVSPARSRWTQRELAVHRMRWDRLLDDDDRGPATALKAVQDALPEDAIVTLDVGAHRIAASHVWRCAAPNRLLQSNGFSSMGYGLPAAIAARLARPSSPVCCVTGDMGLWMTLGELGVVQDRMLDLVVVYLADESLSLIELKQERMGLRERGVRFRNPHVEALGVAFGGRGVRARGYEAVRAAVTAGLDRGGLTLIEAQVEPASYREQM